MILRRSFWRDGQGATAVEFGITAPFFVAILFGIIEGSLLVWTQLGLQHATEMAAQCASINTGTCGSSTTVQNYAVQQALGLTVPASTFTLTTPGCGNQVNASYTYRFITSYFGTPSLTITAQSCFPK